MTEVPPAFISEVCRSQWVVCGLAPVEGLERGVFHNH